MADTTYMSRTKGAKTTEHGNNKHSFHKHLDNDITVAQCCVLRALSSHTDLMAIYD